MLNLIVEILLLYTLFFFLIEYSKAHRVGLKGKELWTEIVINKWGDFVSGGAKLTVLGVIVGGVYFSYCDDRDFEQESWFNKKFCAYAFHEQRNQAREERMQDKQLAHEKELKEIDKEMQDKQFAHDKERWAMAPL